VEIKVIGTELFSEGPLLITHVGMSAPSILKLSAFGAIELAQRNYQFDIEINFVRKSYEDCLQNLKDYKQEIAKKTVYNAAQFDLPKRLWQKLMMASDMTQETRWADMNKYQLENLTSQLTQAIFKVNGKSTFKE